MSDEKKNNNFPAEESEITNPVLDAASELMLDSSVPTPVRRGVRTVVKRLFSAVIDPLERGSAEKWAETKSRIRIKEALTDEIIQKLEIDPEFPQRAVKLFGNRILREQFSLEKILGFTTDILKKKKYDNAANQQTDSEVEKSMSEDWFNVFEKEASQKSSEDMQSRFAKVLAGEIEKPGSYSIKAVKALGDMDQTIANLFQRLCSVCIVLQDLKDLPNKFPVDIRVPAIGGNPAQNSLLKYGLSFDKLNILNEYDLIIADYNSYMNYNISIVGKNNSGNLPFHHQGRYWILKPSPERSESNEFRINGVALSNVGRELFHIVEHLPMPQYTQELKEFFEGQNLQMVEVLIERSGQNIRWRAI